ncbi:MAG: 3-isopropylmalate dehydratase small subunit [Bacteroidota bacterium]
MIRGRVHKYGDNIDTDVIIPARYCTAFTEKELGPHCLEDLDPEFVRKVQKGDMIVGGRNFGCGSSRENAPIAIKGAGVSCVVAKSFARIFYRNAINIGLPILESVAAAEEAETGDEIEVDLSAGTITNLTKSRSYQTSPFPDVIQEIINAGGMVGFAKKRLAERKEQKSNSRLRDRESATLKHK